MSRIPDHPVDGLFLRRWSPRAMSGEPLTVPELMTLFEAARWAPSSGNAQPWRFVYALTGTTAFRRFFDLLADGNKPWCERAGALLVIGSRTLRPDGQRLRTHSFDAGAAWMSLALQATAMGLVAHGMEGFDYERAREVVGLPADHAVECMVALGRPGRVEDLPERYRPREVPSGREVVTNFAFAGAFPRPGS